ncbi:MAG: PEGA domain-containing protein [Pseudomonadota bacterium]|nr:PEGA domain-containing protein [Pseudomonadota bacterium]
MFQKSFLSVLIISLFLSSCSMFNWTQTPIRIQASEPNAKIYVNGNFIGTELVDTFVPRHTYTSILVRKEGFKPTHREISYRLSTIGTIDLIFGCVLLIPLIGLAFPGAYVAEQENITILMEKE